MPRPAPRLAPVTTATLPPSFGATQRCFLERCFVMAVSAPGAATAGLKSRNLADPFLGLDECCCNYFDLSAVPGSRNPRPIDPPGEASPAGARNYHILISIGCLRIPALGLTRSQSGARMIKCSGILEEA